MTRCSGGLAMRTQAATDIRPPQCHIFGLFEELRVACPGFQKGVEGLAVDYSVILGCAWAD
jgi:hypothetical protein